MKNTVTVRSVGIVDGDMLRVVFVMHGGAKKSRANNDGVIYSTLLYSTLLYSILLYTTLYYSRLDYTILD